jgi:hypothetical protein
MIGYLAKPLKFAAAVIYATVKQFSKGMTTEQARVLPIPAAASIENSDGSGPIRQEQDIYDFSEFSLGYAHLQGEKSRLDDRGFLRFKPVCYHNIGYDNYSIPLKEIRETTISIPTEAAQKIKEKFGDGILDEMLAKYGIMISTEQEKK